MKYAIKCNNSREKRKIATENQNVSVCLFVCVIKKQRKEFSLRILRYA